MSDLHDLYQGIILDHNRQPRNYGPIAGATHMAKAFNPFCGDRVTVYVAVEGERISRVTFEGSGCAISTASASLMTEALTGRTVAEAVALFDDFNAMIAAAPASPVADVRLGPLSAFAGVREYPSRVKCAGLAWDAFRTAVS